MAKLELQKQITDVNGKVLELQLEDGTKRSMTMKDAVQGSVLNYEMDKKDGKAKFEAYQLAMKCNASDPDFSVEDLKNIKDSVGKLYGAVIVGFVYNEIEYAKS